MITISLTLNVQLDAADLAAFDARLGAIARGVALLAGDAGNQPQRREDRKEDQEDQEDLSVLRVSAVEENSPNAPKQRKINPRPPKMPARPVAHETAPIHAVTMNHDGMDGPNGINKVHESHESYLSPAAQLASAADPEVAAHPSNRLPFAEFDKLARAEMKRLSMDGRLPGHKLWNNERDPRLPTMAAILLRYGAPTLLDLARVLGLQPPLSATKESRP